MGADGDVAWQEKYAQLQERSNTRQALLRRGLVCVSLAVDNIDPGLEQGLKRLRQLLRGEWASEELAVMVDAMEATVRQLDEHRQQDRTSRGELMQQLISQLQRLQPERDQQKRLEALLKKSAAGVADFQPLLGEFIAIFADVLEKISHAGSAPSKRRGLLGRLFGHEQTPPSLAMDAAEADPVAMPVPGFQQQAWQEARLRIAEVLMGMLEQVREQQGERVDSLSQRWAQVQEPQAVAELIDESLNLHQGLVLARTRETEDFLLHMQRRLLDVHKFLLQQGQQQAQERQAQEALGRSVGDEISALRHHAAEARSLDQLQASIEARLEGIVGLVDAYREQSVGRARSLHTEVQELENKLKRLEGESRHLREVVRQEHHRATHDALTGLANRQAYEERAQMEFGRWKRYGHPLSVLVVDVDRFKAVNDQYGHLAGDKVLRLVAQSLQKAVREADFLARYGGEEFVVILPQTALDGAILVAEKLRSEVAASPFHFSGQPVPITCSIGVSELRSGDEWEALVERADQALLRAKREGRNRVLAD